MTVRVGDTVWFHPDTQLRRKTDERGAPASGPWMENKSVRRGHVDAVTDDIVRVTTRNSAGPGRTGVTTWRVRPARITSVQSTTEGSNA